jgi:ATP/maltotriose-dependent transcriptional regulator MalT
MTGRSTQPETSPTPVIIRPRLLRRLGLALERRLTLVVADAGFGKSTTLAAWARTVPCIWYAIGREDTSLAVFTMGIALAFERRLPPISRQLRLVVQTSLGPDGDESDRAGPVATLLCQALEQELDHELALVFDDAHALWSAGASSLLLEELCRQAPDRLHIILSTRAEPPFPVQRLRGRGEVLDLDASALAFSEDEVAELLRRTLPDETHELAEPVHRLTGGWPAAVRLTAEALRTAPRQRTQAALEGLNRPDGRLLDYVAEEVLGSVSPAIRELLRCVTPFDRFNAGLCTALGADCEAETLRGLRRSGLFLEPRDATGEWFGVHALIRNFVRERWPLDESELIELHARAARWFEAQHRFEDELESLIAIEDVGGIASVLGASGSALLSRGRVDVIIRAGACLPPGSRGESIEQLIGEAHEVRGDWDEALACFERAAPAGASLEAGLAWRLGLIHHLRGQLNEALEIYDRGSLEASNSPDAPLLLAWKASALWLRGDGDRCREAAEEAFVRARAIDDPRSLAAAHTVLAMLAALTGDRLANDAHYLRALDYAEQAGDVLQAVRVRTNRGSRHLEEGEYDEALAELEIAIQLGELTGFIFFRALAMANRGDVYFRLGRLEQAAADLEASRLLYQRAGSRMVCYPLEKLGDVYRFRGELALARTSYEEAVSRAEESGDTQGLVPALAGLAQVVAEEEPGRAQELVDRALSFGDGMGYVAARLAAGWVGLIHRDRELAAASAEQAASAARIRRDRAGLAEALQLEALAISEPNRQVARLEEAISLWRVIRDPLREAGAELILGVIAHSAASSARAKDAEELLQEAGAHGYRALLLSVLTTPAIEEQVPVSVLTLGRFAVAREGEIVGRDEWQSKKARDLLKLIVTRRGKPATRDWLMETLWPGQDPGLLSNRLCVALSTLRSVLDPERRLPPDHFVIATADWIQLQSGNVDADVERFLAQGQAALNTYRDGNTSAARPPLEA